MSKFRIPRLHSAGTTRQTLRPAGCSDCCNGPSDTARTGRPVSDDRIRHPRLCARSPPAIRTAINAGPLPPYGPVMPSGPDRQTGSHRPGHPRFSGPPWPRTWKSNRNERYDFNRPGFRHSPRWPRPSTFRIKRATNRTMAGLPDSGIPREESPAARTPSSRRLTCRNIRLYLRPICLESIKFYNFVSICTFRYTGKTKNYLIKNTMANK